MIDLVLHFPVIWQLSNENMKTVLKAMQNVLASYGIPEIKISDNGPCIKAMSSMNSATNFTLIMSLVLHKSPGQCYSREMYTNSETLNDKKPQ